MGKTVFVKERDILVCKATGKDSVDFTIKMWTEVKARLDKDKKKTALVISDMENAGSFFDYFRFFEIAKNIGYDNTYSIAYVELNKEASTLVKFAEDFLFNRGLKAGKTFNSEKEAREWLKKYI